MTINAVMLGCMIEALVKGQQVEAAHRLFQEWKGRVTCDTPTYSALLKGFTKIDELDRAVAVYQDLRQSGV